ncbi:sensor histidine kinase [Streptomyces ficellus]|uniref:Histidine kinase/HSP90-like ATPase domain-containing protein n=1 Tax=Streptomyces ficellus TaxID=1977088 RepID=A0A6I6FM92_9ACTN|nr:ATP-binding protein [Streptomyces ficellus]QGV80119.1 hypothetical protein EIZ62_19160 [Streptomyces ficellus]
MSGTLITATLVERAERRLRAERPAPVTREAPATPATPEAPRAADRGGRPGNPDHFDRFAAALTEGLSRAAVTARAVRGAPRPGRSAPAPRTGPVRGRYQAEETLRRFRARLEEHPDAPPAGAATGSAAERDALLGLAHRVVRRLAGDPDTPTGPAPQPPAPHLAPERLLTASLLLAECAVRCGGAAEDVLPAVRDVFSAAVREASGTRDLWQERRALAREVHDRVSGPLTAALRGLDGGGRPAADALRGVLTQAADGARDIVAGLHRRTPVPGLRGALDDVRALAEARGLSVEWSLTGDEAGLPELFRRELALVVREALLNAVAHASANRVVVTTRITRRWAHTHIQDDGTGFDVAHTLGSRPAHGLRAMSERMESVGGRLAIRSAAGGGTRVDIHLPRYRPVQRTIHQLAEKRSCHA